MLLAVIAALCVAPGATAQLDLSVDALEVTQAIESPNALHTAGRSTMVRATLLVSGSATDVSGVDGVLRLFVGGVEAPESPVYSTNGPMVARLAPSQEVLDDTLNFVFLAPTSDDVVITVAVNPPGPNAVVEVDTSNNLASTATLDFATRAVPELAYAPIDNDSSGGSNPNAPDPASIEPGVGDNFLQGVFPSKDWFYHRIDAPTKLWTGSLQFSSGGTTLNNSLVVDANLMVPIPDRIYGFAPGALPGYNGVAILNGLAAMGNGEPSRLQRTCAHEIAHTFGFQHTSSLLVDPGIDVEHHLAITESLPPLKPGTLADFMVAALSTSEAWVSHWNWDNLSNHAAFAGAPATAAPGMGAPGMKPQPEPKAQPWRGPSLIVTGLWNRESGVMEATDVLAFTGGALSEPAPASAANLRVRAWAGGSLVREVTLRADAAPDCTDPPSDAPVAGADGLADGGARDADGHHPVTGFQVVMPAETPAGAPIDRVEVAARGGSSDDWAAPSLVLTRSAAAPEVAFTSAVGTPLAESPLTTGRVTERVFDVSWTGSDADGDALQYYLVYRPDGGERRVPVMSSLGVTSMTVDLGDMPGLMDGHGCFELYASDGLNTTRIESARLSAPNLGVGNNAPWVEIMTPDDGRQSRFGATAILHSSGWDLEDRALTGASLEWASDLDGLIGTGRLLSTADLSVGTHVITVTATDSGALTSSDTASLVVLPRDLPTESPWRNLGFGLAGTSGEPQLVGTGDLVGGNPMSIDLTDARASAPAFLFVGFTELYFPFFYGGTLVPDPNPPGLLHVVFTNASGELSLGTNWPGGLPSGFEIVLQYWIDDPAAPFGYAASNGLKGTTP